MSAVGCHCFDSIFMKLCKEDLLVNNFKSVEEILDMDCQSKDMADFHNLKGKLESLALSNIY